MNLYTFMAYETDNWGNRFIIGTRTVTPGVDDLYKSMRDFGSTECNFGKYRIFDQDPDSLTHQFHVFESGLVQIVPTRVIK